LIPSKSVLDQLVTEIKEGTKTYGAYKGRLGESEKTLAEYLAFDEEMDHKFSRLFAYAQQKSDEDTTVGEYQALVSTAGTLALKAMEAAAFAEPEILGIPKERMEQFMESEELSHYKLLLSRLLAKKDHMLSEAEERILAGCSEVAEAPANVFGLFNNADAKFPVIKGENGEDIEVTHGRYGSLLESRNRQVREAAFHGYYSVYRQFANTVAAAFEGNLKQACFFARTRKYSSSRAASLASNEVPEKVYDNLLETMNARISSLHRYVALRKERLGVDTLHMYDLYVPMTGNFDKKYTYEEAKDIILTALKPLGEEYGELLKEGFSHRWIDVYENQGKRSGGYSNHVYGFHPYVLMSYDDTLNSLLTLAHEMGHSLHSWYSDRGQSRTYAGYKIFVAEVASTCNEVLVLRYLIDHAESREEKAFLINQLLERFRATMFRQTMFA